MALTEATPRRRIVKEVGAKFPITLSGTVVAGDAIGYASGWVRALATVGTAIDMELVALEDGDSGDVIEVAAAAVIGGFTGGTPGGPAYNEEGAGVGGGYTETAPSTTNDVNTIIGRILSATEIFVNPSVRAGSVA